MSTHRVIGLALGLLLATGAVVGGYAAGHARAPSADEARQERVSAERHAFSAAYRRAELAARARGAADGRRKGALRGRRLGRKRGLVAGKAAAEKRRADAAAAAERTRQAAIEARTRERVENCGAPLFVNGYCPTDEEVAQESQAESLCGGGRYEEARAQGIACFPPGDPRNP